MNSLSGFSGNRYPSRVPFLTMMLFGIIGLLISGKFAFENVSARSWPTTQGTLQAEAPGAQGSRNLNYIYTVSGKSYTAQVFHVGSNTTLDPSVEISYDPGNAAHGCVKLDNMPIIIMGLLLSLALTLAGFLQYVGGEKSNMGSNWRL